jgi:tail tape-measure protein
MAARGIVIQITGEGESARKALEMVQQHLREVGAQSTRTGSEVAAAMETAKRALESVGVGLGIAEAVRGLREAVGGALEYGEAIERASKKTGLAAGTLSTLHYAAAVTGGDFDKMTSAVAKMDKTIGGAVAGNKQAQTAMRELGLNAKDLAGRSDGAEVAFKKLAERIAATENPIVRAKIATDALGRAGAEQIPMLMEVGAHWDEWVAKAKAAGQYLDGEHAAALAATAQKMKDLEQRVSGAGISFTEGLLPALNSFLAVVRGGKGDFDVVANFGAIAGKGFLLATSAAYGMASAVAGLMKVSSYATLDFAHGKQMGALADELAAKAAAARDAMSKPVGGTALGDGPTLPDKGAGGSIASTGAAQRTNAIAEAAAALQQEQARASADVQKSSDQAAMAMLEARHQMELVSDKDFYAQKLALQTDELNAEQAAIEARAGTLGDLLRKQAADKTLKRDSTGTSAEEYKSTAELVKLNEQLVAIEAKRQALAAGAAAENAGANREQTLAGLRAAAELERERNQGIAAQIALMKQEKELEAEKLDANGDHAAAQQTRETADLLAQKMQIEQINKQIELSEAAVKAQVAQLVDEANKDPRLKAENAQKIAALNQQEAANVAALVAQYKALALAIGDPALIAKSKELESELAKLNDPEQRQAAQFAKTFTSGLDQMAESMAQNAARGKESFSQMVNSMLSDLAKLLTKLALLRIQQASAAGGGSGSLGSFFSALFGGGGGPSLDSNAGVTGGLYAPAIGGGTFGGIAGSDPSIPYAAAGDSDVRGARVIGEKGPEVWMPPTRGGAILSNKQLADKISGGGGGKAPNVSMSIVNNSRQPVTASQPEVDWDSQTRQMVTRIILEDHASGGPISQVSQSQG